MVVANFHGCVCIYKKHRTEYALAAANLLRTLADHWKTSNTSSAQLHWYSCWAWPVVIIARMRPHCVPHPEIHHTITPSQRFSENIHSCAISLHWFGTCSSDQKNVYYFHMLSNFTLHMTSLTHSITHLITQQHIVTTQQHQHVV